MLTKFTTSEKGFTLIELLIVVAIIGILAAIAIPQFSAYKERSYIAGMQADAKSIATAQEAYFVDKGTYLATTAAADLASYGLKAMSAGNTFAVAAVTDIAKDFKVTVSNAAKTAKTATFDSTTGETKVQ